MYPSQSGTDSADVQLDGRQRVGRDAHREHTGAARRGPNDRVQSRALESVPGPAWPTQLPNHQCVRQSEVAGWDDYSGADKHHAQSGGSEYYLSAEPTLFEFEP